ncbi:MAG: deoxyhypusine synthase family protein [Candidatus Omnitrophota bacterium]|nr:deoxyhypusine synthase family protein [Candidatus Omnitrophota bacterium]
MQLFDRSILNIKPLAERKHDLNLSVIKPLTSNSAPGLTKRMLPVCEDIICAKEEHKAIILMIGAHVIRSGVQNYIIDLMKRGYVSCIAMNGAGMIHDFEFALIGATTESVSRYIKEGQFGLWQETGILNDIINKAYAENSSIGMGEAVGSYIEKQSLAHKSISILAWAYRLNIPVTIHIGIGYDIVHEHPNCNGAATGGLSYNDFLKFVSVAQNFENGVVMNFGSSVMAPEVFLKALSMARNAARQRGEEIKHFTTLVCDLVKLQKIFKKEPPKNKADYYFRPWKTMLVRTVADGGKSFYIRGCHADTIPALWFGINKTEDRIGKKS